MRKIGKVEPFCELYVADVDINLIVWTIPDPMRPCKRSSFDSLALGHNIGQRTTKNEFQVFFTDPTDLPKPINDESFQLLCFSSNFD